jgi:Fur family ferric uptake transcriptional regulator
VIRPARPCEWSGVTVPHRTAALRAPSPTAAVVALRARGMRVSAPRRALLEALYAAPGPRTADELAGQLRLDLASVYRNLDQLEAVGLLRHDHAGHGPGGYALAARRAAGAAACEACGRRAELPDAALAAIRAAVQDATGFTADLGHFPVVGRCRDCANHPPKEHHAHP